MKNYIYKSALTLCFVSMLFSCQRKQMKDPLPSWNETEIKQQIINYINVESKNIPKDARIAVFDMDGTISCETPLWFEMAVAVQGMVDQLEKDPGLINKTEYKYAKLLSENPTDTTVLNHWVVDNVNYLDSVIMKAFDRMDHEAYVNYARKFLSEKEAPNYGMVYGDMFYQPMLELIEYLKENEFEVYIVSGSMQGVIWSICPQTIDLNREHLIGTRQTLVPDYKPGNMSFIIQKGIDLPKNDGNGKSLNIYSRIGKIPVFAFGNTTGDFGMFHLVSTSPYPHMALMLNHDDAEREYVYEPYHGTAVPNWQDSLRLNNWVQVNMSQEFNILWKANSTTPIK